MDRTEQLKTLNRMLDDARRLEEGADPLLTGLCATIRARIELLVSLVDEKGAGDDEAA